eukprot:2833906-Pleurochrysis_carterae.AAC.1
MSVVEAILIAVEGMTCDNCRGLVESQARTRGGRASACVHACACAFEHARVCERACGRLGVR